MKHLATIPLFTTNKRYTVNNVLIIDDDKVCRLILTRNIERADFAKHVTEVNNVKEAFAELRNVHRDTGSVPDIIFLDINMPDMDGWEFLEEFSKMPELALLNTKIVMLSSSYSAVDVKRARCNSQVYEYIEKPISVEKLVLLGEKLRADKILPAQKLIS